MRRPVLAPNRLPAFAQAMREVSPGAAAFDALVELPSPAPHATVAEAMYLRAAQITAEGGSHRQPTESFVSPERADIPLACMPAAIRRCILDDLIADYFLSNCERTLLTTAGLEFAKQYIAMQPAEDQLALFRKLGDELMSEITSAAQMPVNDARHGVDRAIEALVNKEAESEAGGGEDSELMLTMVVFRDQHLKLDTELLADVPPRADGIDEQDIVLINHMAVRE